MSDYLRMSFFSLVKFENFLSPFKRLLPLVIILNLYTYIIFSYHLHPSLHSVYVLVR